jgi:hypothetical protein
MYKDTFSKAFYCSQFTVDSQRRMWILLIPLVYKKRFTLAVRNQFLETAQDLLSPLSPAINLKKAVHPSCLLESCFGYPSFHTHTRDSSF